MCDVENLALAHQMLQIPFISKEDLISLDGLKCAVRVNGAWRRNRYHRRKLSLTCTLHIRQYRQQLVIIERAELHATLNMCVMVLAILLWLSMKDTWHLYGCMPHVAYSSVYTY